MRENRGADRIDHLGMLCDRRVCGNTGLNIREGGKAAALRKLIGGDDHPFQFGSVFCAPLSGGVFHHLISYVLPDAHHGGMEFFVDHQVVDGLARTRSSRSGPITRSLSTVASSWSRETSPTPRPSSARR